ncbi:MAG: thiamine phosphate synthase [Bacteroides sp.]|nr:thiamine phosphate synthase [Bacteroides sp.]
MPRLQFITHTAGSLSLVESARKALALGIRWIQFRCKEEPPAGELREMTRQVQELCKEHGALFVIDDRVELASELQADGVHLGKSDMPIRQAREILGERFIIGGTANTLQDMKEIAAQGGDYIGLGPFRFTSTKERLSPLLGLDGYRNLMAEARKAGVLLPVYAIGGIRSGDAAGLKACGVDGLAVSSALLSTEDPAREAAAFLRYFGA